MRCFCGKLRGYISMISSCLCDFCEPKHVHFAWTSKKNVANTLVESPRHGTMNNCSSTYLYCGTITSFYCGTITSFYCGKMISKSFFKEKKTNPPPTFHFFLFIIFLRGSFFGPKKVKRRIILTSEKWMPKAAAASLTEGRASLLQMCRPSCCRFRNTFETRDHWW